MCYNKTTSLGAFVFGTIFTLLLISKKKYNYALFNSSIVFMQLIEYFGHISLEQKNDTLNTIVSGSILTLVFLQPLVYIYAFYNKNEFTNSNYIIYLILFSTFIYILFLSSLFYSNKLKISYFNKDCINYCRMNWKFFSENLYLSIPFFIMYFFLFHQYRPKNRNIVFNQLFYYTIGLSILYMILVDHLKGIKNYYSAFGSIWCIFSVIYGPIAYFYG